MVKGFNRFINYCLRVLFLLIVIGSFAMLYLYPKVQYREVEHIFLKGIIVTIFNIVIAVVLYKYGNKNGWNKRAVACIIIAGFILRLLWTCLVNTQPTSDFELIYNFGKDFSEGNYHMFKGASYIGRFPHLTTFVIYLGLLRKVFGNTLVPIKIINVILSTLNIYLAYLITCEVYEDKRKQVLSLMGISLFPPLIVYTSVICSENIAMSFFLAAIYLFLLIVKKNQNVPYLILCGFLLAAGNLFRMVGYIFLAAFILYLIIYSEVKTAIKNSTLILLTFLITFYTASDVLIKSEITEHKLWRGSEPTITSVLRGTNIKSHGMWNKEDSDIPSLYDYDYNRVEKASKNIIKKRLATTPKYKLTLFYISKFIGQWSIGDFYGVGWATEKVEGQKIIVDFAKATSVYSQLFYIAMILQVYLGLFNSREYLENKNVNLFYIFFCGFALLYLITEMQPRYAFITCWIFAMLMPTCDISIFKKHKKSIRYELEV